MTNHSLFQFFLLPFDLCRYPLMEESVFADTWKTKNNNNYYYVWGDYQSTAPPEHRSPLSALQVFSSVSWRKWGPLCSRGTLTLTELARLIMKTEVSNYFSLSCRRNYEWKGLLFWCRRMRKHWSHTRANWFLRYSRCHLLEEQDWHTTWWTRKTNQKLCFSPFLILVMG